MIFYNAFENFVIEQDEKALKIPYRICTRTDYLFLQSRFYRKPAQHPLRKSCTGLEYGKLQPREGE
jgi:hypothetical protein